MKRFLILLTLVAATFSCDCPKALDTIDVIPLPAEVSLSGKTVPVSGMATISCEGNLQAEAEYLKNSLGDAYSVVNGGGKIRLSINDALSEEEYDFTVSGSRIRIEGGSPCAVFYGIQTLLQEIYAYDGLVMKGKIHDLPRYPWRGYMLDESRHFFGEEYVRQTLDMMARFKLNKFHWHLTDAPGWRIEIKAFPLLTEIGARGDNDGLDKPAQFYTQEQIRGIIEYASQRHIDIIPEIDMPGHASSATRSYPELAVGEAGSFTYNPGKQEVYEFIGKVLDEVAGLFPYEYLHIGGDEVFFGNSTWAEDPDIKALMQKEGMSKIEEAEAYFIKWASAYVDSLGKKMIAWDDVLELGAGHCGTALSWWRQERPDHLEKGAEEGYQMILCPRLPLYFDFVQDPDHQVGRKAWGRKKVQCSVRDIYDFPDSLFCSVNISKDAVIGLQANLWSELVATTRRAQFLTYPRMCSLAESAWTVADRKEYESFSDRLEHSFRLFDSLGIYYYDSRDSGRHSEPER